MILLKCSKERNKEERIPVKILITFEIVEIVLRFLLKICAHFEKNCVNVFSIFRAFFLVINTERDFGFGTFNE